MHCTPIRAIEECVPHGPSLLASRAGQMLLAMSRGHTRLGTNGDKGRSRVDDRGDKMIDRESGR